jgi:site-specific recombinase XerD
VAESLIEQSPVRNVKSPRVPNDQVQPFTPDQVQALLNAAQATEQRERNRAVLLILLDTGSA